MRRITYAPEAVQDLDDIFRLVAMNDGVLRAQSVLDKIRHACEKMSGIMLLGTRYDHIVPGLRKTGVAGLKRCVLMFRVVPDGIEIQRISYLGRNIFPPDIE